MSQNEFNKYLYNLSCDIVNKIDYIKNKDASKIDFYKEIIFINYNLDILINNYKIHKKCKWFTTCKNQDGIVS